MTCNDRADIYKRFNVVSFVFPGDRCGQ